MDPIFEVTHMLDQLQTELGHGECLAWDVHALHGAHQTQEHDGTQYWGPSGCRPCMLCAWPTCCNML